MFAWNVDQASDNYGELSELHDPVRADYAGQSPMVGFGAGAYLLALYDRGKPPSPTCGDFAEDPAASDDAGSDANVGADGSGISSGGPEGGTSGASVDGGGIETDAGGSSDGASAHASSGGCGCVLVAAPGTESAIAALLPVALLALRRRRA